MDDKAMRAVFYKPTMQRGYFNPLEFLEEEFGVIAPHITYDPNMHPQYRIIRGSTHDGTWTFSRELVLNVMMNLLNQETFFLGDPEVPDYGRRHGYDYTVGHCRRAVLYGIVDLPVGRYPGVKERLCLPVRSKIRYDESMPLSKPNPPRQFDRLKGPIRPPSLAHT
jgi:hypothetical protein